MPTNFYQWAGKGLPYVLVLGFMWIFMTFTESSILMPKDILEKVEENHSGQQSVNQKLSLAVEKLTVLIEGQEKRMNRLEDKVYE